MAVLTDANRIAAWAKYMSDISSAREAIAISKVDLRAAIDAIDDWVEANQLSFNSALPQPARGSLTAKQKAALLMYVVQKRYEVE